ncbi:MAG: hypothetical protein O7E53_08085 [Alphaproteobacteria bacterium]|nr:hypothetical protein [Alphaproteobacteria bacterium]
MGLKQVFGLGAVAFAFTMAACAGPPTVTTPPPTSEVETATAEIEAPAETTPRRKSTPKALARGAPTPKARAPKAPAPTAPAKAEKSVAETPPSRHAQTANLAAPVDPRRIMGLTRAELSDFLGKPHFRRRDITAEIWQYRHAECTLDVFLYESGNDYRVLHFEMRQGKAEAASRTRCLAALLDAHNRDGAGSG